MIYFNLQLTFGVKAALVILQQMTNMMLTGIDGTAAHLDDIIVVEVVV